jgi:outer membrane protein TolC
MTRQVIAPLLCLVAAHALVAHPASAQIVNVEQPPVIHFDPGGIGLAEAVTVALQNDPQLKLQDAEVQRSAGVEQEARGQFDTVFLNQYTFSYRVQELTENRKENERLKRDSLREELENNRVSRDNAQALVDQLRRVQSAPPGSSEVQELTRLSPTLGAQVQMLDVLIQSASGQQRTDLLNVRNTLLSDTLTTSQQNLQQLTSTYDAAQSALIKLGVPPIDEVFYSGGLRFDLPKQYRNGIIFTPFFDGFLDGTNFKGKPRSEEFGGKGIQDLFTFHAGAEFIVPLARGRGATAVAARERAAGLEVESSRLTLQYDRSLSALTTVNAYWTLRGAQDALDIATRSAALYGQITTLTNNLIQAGDLPAVELSRAQAGEARARARVEQAQRSVYDARAQLATVMGVATDGDQSTLPTARDPFAPVAEPTAPLAQIPDWVTSAPNARRDVAAAAKAQESAEVLRQGAQTNLRPRLDLSTNLFHTALEERTISAAIDRWVGPSTTTVLDFEKPLGNNFFRGQLLQADASAKQQTIAAANLRRQVRLGVIRAAGTLPDALTRVRNARDNVQFSQAVIVAEVQRFQQNEATLLDTIITEQQASDAALELVAAQQDLAQLIAELRFETGTLAPEGPVNIQNLITPPPPSK